VHLSVFPESSSSYARTKRRERQTDTIAATDSQRKSMEAAERQVQYIAPRYIEQNDSSSFCG
jgi:hypothetical protein